MVTAINIKYFDTIPLCVSLNVLKTGFLFAAAEFGNHVLYQFQGIGDDNDDEELQQVCTPAPTARCNAPPTRQYVAFRSAQLPGGAVGGRLSALVG